MKREIKFRAWHKAAKEMLFDSWPGESLRWAREGQPVEIMQYTGLKDRNGKEIYEDDVVDVENGKYKGIVKFNEQDLSYVIEDKTGGYGFVNGQTYDERPEYRTYEVIGNRWDNPDLLEGRYE